MNKLIAVYEMMLKGVIAAQKGLEGSDTYLHGYYLGREMELKNVIKDLKKLQEVKNVHAG